METDSQRRVLVVEDNSALATVLQFNLQQAGFDVVHAANGRVAYEITLRESFDLIISDEQMPEMTGLEFCRLYRATATGGDVPIVLLTAKKLELDSHQLSRELSISEIMGKPFSPRAIVRLARELTDRACENVST